MLGQLDSLFSALLNCIADESESVVLQALEVLAIIAQQHDGKSGPEGSRFELLLVSEHLHVKNHVFLNIFQRIADHFDLLMRSLLQHFKRSRDLLAQRGTLTICKMCTLLGAEKTYRQLSLILEKVCTT